MDVYEIDDQVDLLEAFITFDGFRTMMNNLLRALYNANSAASAVLALEGLFRIDKEIKMMNPFECQGSVYENIRTFLRKWRCESPLNQAYTGAYNRVVPFLRSLTIFKTLEVPLFIDDYGNKQLMSDYQPLENIDINLDTPIVHVTHTNQKEQIVENQKFIPSDRKNIIKGIWFSPKSQLGDPPNMSSVYGKWAFETTLRKLGVTGIRQGEILSYTKEVNFILYASDTVPQFPALWKATDEAVKVDKCDAYAAVSIFVPSRFLPETREAFRRAFGQPDEQLDAQPYHVSHEPFCVKQMREDFDCKDLDT